MNSNIMPRTADDLTDKADKDAPTYVRSALAYPLGACFQNTARDLGVGKCAYAP